ncbi:hypothetical protein TNCV_2010551 [Trichonephila clavipes]|nr:hypothetical protein TNCV_2010551 [Trichonephila clavipes]
MRPKPVSHEPGRWTSLGTGTRSETKIRFNGCQRNNRLYQNSRRESIKENRYLKTLPHRGRLEEENGRTRTKLKYVTRARNGRAQEGGLTAPKRVRGAPKTQWE